MMRDVAPFAGAWIEISAPCAAACCGRWSLPSRERGLKFALLKSGDTSSSVAPFAGAWIEIRCRI